MRAVLLAALLVAMFSACASHSSGASDRQTTATDTLVVADREEPRTLSPLLIGGLSEDLQVLLFSCLLRSGPSGQLITDIAARVPTIANGGVSANGRTITYALRPGLQWQDGVPLTARDIVYTFDQIMNPKNLTGARVPYTDVDSLAALDDRTLRVKLKRVNAAFVRKFFAASFCWGILPQHLLHAYAELNDVPFNAMPVGSGPFRVERWSRGDRLVLVPNPRYFRGAPHFRIVDRFIPDRSTIVTQLRSGELDADFRADPTEASATAGNPRLHVYTTAVQAAGMLIFNVTDPILREPAMRIALAHAIDAAAAARSVSQGRYLASEVGRASFGWAFDPKLPHLGYDPDRANRMFDALGWLRGADGLRHKDGKPLALTLVGAADGLDPAFCVTLQFQLRRAGVDVDVKTFSASTLYAPAAAGGPLRSGAFALAYVPQYFIDFDADNSFALRCDRMPPKGYNLGHYCNPLVDRANERALVTLDETKRKAEYRVVQQQLAIDPPWLLLWQLTKVDIVSRRLHGFIPTPRYDPYYRVTDWHLTP